MEHSQILPSCPVLHDGQSGRVTLAHGEGGRLTRHLLRERVFPRLMVDDLGDAASLPPIDGPIAFTTDSFVVTPLFFPGGDIGTLAVCGTVNDLCVAGAHPHALSLALILEEGLAFDILDRVIESVAIAAQAEGVRIVTGDTKVVPRGAADGLFLTTSGIGRLIAPIPPGANAIQPGDHILVTGPLGRHGIAVLAAREGLGLSPVPVSDVASLRPAVEALRSAGVNVRAQRDATRGGLAAVLHEWAEASGIGCLIEEELVPVQEETRGACELLGLDPIYIANEGVMVIAVPASEVDGALRALRAVPVSAHTVCVGKMQSRSVGPVLVRRVSGRVQLLDEPVAAHLPRIC